MDLPAHAAQGAAASVVLIWFFHAVTRHAVVPGLAVRVCLIPKKIVSGGEIGSIIVPS